MSSFSFVPTPFNNESVISLLYRCVHENGFFSLADLSAACGGLHFSSLPAAQYYGSRTHKLIRNDPLVTDDQRAKLDAIFFKNTEVSKNSVQCGKINFTKPMLRSRLAICPDCAKDRHLNVMHTFAISEVCPVHSKVYAKECPNCKRALNWTSLSDFHCACLFDLRDTPVDFADNTWSKIAFQAYIDGDQKFYDRFQTFLSTNHFLCSGKYRHEAINSCVRMAMGDKSTFFHETRRIQGNYPSLHIRAILAPFMTSKDELIRSFALEYYCKVLQTKPMSHAQTCQCSDIPFTRHELSLILGSAESALELIKSEQCSQVKKLEPFNKAQRLYKCKELCMTLATNDSLEWSDEDLLPNPSPDFKLISIYEACEILDSPKTTVEQIIKLQLLETIKLPGGIFTTQDWIESFKRNYFTRPQLCNLLNLHDETIDQLLKHKSKTPYPKALDTGRGVLHPKKHLPQYIRNVLDSPHTSKLASIRAEHIDIRSAAAFLRLNETDVAKLAQLGIIKFSKYQEKSRKFFTQQEIDTAIKWRESYLTLEEAANIIGCTAQTLSVRFIRTRYVEVFMLLHRMISVEDVNKCLRHYNMYSLPVSKQITLFNNLMKSGEIRPLPSDHPDALLGHLVFYSKDVESALIPHMKKPTS